MEIYSSLQENPNSSVPPSLVKLDAVEKDFLHDLELLDAIPPRTSDTIHVFYIKSGQRVSFDILRNVVSASDGIERVSLFAVLWREYLSVLVEKCFILHVLIMLVRPWYLRTGIAMLRGMLAWTYRGISACFQSLCSHAVSWRCLTLSWNGEFFKFKLNWIHRLACHFCHFSFYLLDKEPKCWPTFLGVPTISRLASRCKEACWMDWTHSDQLENPSYWRRRCSFQLTRHLWLSSLIFPSLLRWSLSG